LVNSIAAPDSVAALGELISLTLKEGETLSDRFELLSVLTSIRSAERLNRTRRFIRSYKQVVGTNYWNRAKTLYSTSKPLRWKVSYRGRVIGIGKQPEENQIQSIINSLARTPGANTLTFSFYRPNDHKRARALPASMPCPIAGDFKYRKSRLHLNVFFRTHDVYRLGFPDLFFMRLLQYEVLSKAKAINPRKLAQADLGELNVFFSRAFILKANRTRAKLLLDAIERFEAKCRG
jgi:thymidylate synthase